MSQTAGNLRDKTKICQRQQ